MQLQGKLRDIAFLQSFAIMLVVIGHAAENVGPMPFFVLNLHKWIYSFHMPLFMFISGYLFMLSKLKRSNFSDGEFIKKRFVRLIYPYLVLSSMVFLLKVLIFNKVAMRPADFTLAFFLEGIIYPAENPIGPFWFLPTLFFISVIAIPVCKNKLLSNKTYIVLSTMVFIIAHIFALTVNIKFLNISGIAQYFIYFWFGSLFYLYLQSQQRLLNHIYVLFCFFFVLSVALNMVNFDYTGKKLLEAITGIIMSFFLAKIATIKRAEYFKPIDGYYYQIFLLSYFFHHLVRIVCYGGLGISFYYNFIVSFFSGLLLPVVIAKFVDRKVVRLRSLIGIAAG